MKVPSRNKLPNEPIFMEFIRSDDTGFLSNKKSSRAFLNKKRVYSALELFRKYLPLADSNEQLLIGDFACGTGNFGLSLLEEGYDVDFVDFEEKFFHYIKEKNTSSKVPCFIKADASQFIGEKKYHGIYLGEAIEHMSDPENALRCFYENLLPGGVLCLTTPNGDYEFCEEPSWKEVKDQKERNQKLANTIGNHVCEFRMNELRELVKLAGFGIHEHTLINSYQVSRRSLLRRILPSQVLFKLDDRWSKKKSKSGRRWGRIQIIIAQKFH